MNIQAHSVMTCESRPGWWQVFSPAIYLISFLPAATVTLLHPSPSLGLVWLATAGVILIQHSVNVANDYTDWIRGADSEKRNSWVLWHSENLPTVKRHSAISLAIGLILGIVSCALLHRVEILAYALPLVSLGLLYNRLKSPLSYSALGDWVTFICYGAVFGCLYYLASGPSLLALWGGSLAYGSLAFAILLAHQPPQILTDSIAGKRCFAVRHGILLTRFVSRTAFAFFFALLLLLAALAGKITLWLGVPTFLFGVVWAFRQTEPSPKNWLLAAVAGHLMLAFSTFFNGGFS